MVAEQLTERTQRGTPSARERAGNGLSGRVRPRATAQRAPMAHRGSRAVRKARELSWRSPMTAAILLGTCVVTVLCIYVHAYAMVTISGFEQSKYKREIKSEIAQEEALRAELSRLSLLPTVEQRAQGMGMVLNAPQAAELLVESPQPRQVAQSDR